MENSRKVIILVLFYFYVITKSLIMCRQIFSTGSLSCLSPAGTNSSRATISEQPKSARKLWTSTVTSMQQLHSSLSRGKENHTFVLSTSAEVSITHWTGWKDTDHGGNMFNTRKDIPHYTPRSVSIMSYSLLKMIGCTGSQDFSAIFCHSALIVRPCSCLVSEFSLL